MLLAVLLILLFVALAIYVYLYMARQLRLRTVGEGFHDGYFRIYPRYYYLADYERFKPCENDADCVTNNCSQLGYCLYY
jgi:hypothetical protein